MGWWPENLTDWVLIISGIATAVLVVIVGRQLTLTKKDFDSRIRPWIAPVDLIEDVIIFKDGSQMKYQEAIIEMKKNSELVAVTISFDLIIKNTGTLPAKVHYKYKVSKNQLTQEDLEKTEITDEYYFMPNSIDHIYIPIDWNDLENKQMKFQIGCLVEYSLPGNHISKVARIWEVDSEGTSVLEDFIGDPQLEE